VHFAGHPADMKEIYGLAKKYKLLVIEDAAHALGAEYKGIKVGSGKYSDMTVFSFHPAKSITTGEGGAITTNNKKFYEKLLMLRNHGIIKQASHFRSGNPEFIEPWYYEMQDLGFNYRITDFQCALGISQLKKINTFIKKRRKIVCIYNDTFSCVEGITIPISRSYIKSSWHIYVLRLKLRNLKKNRSLLFNFLKSKNIQAQVHYIPVYWQPYYRKKLRYQKGLCPLAEKYYAEALTIPLFPKMSMDEIVHVKNTVSKAISLYSI
jgi:dTDP-4-amino-4,6-dideoxygalactose transaminase